MDYDHEWNLMLKIITILMIKLNIYPKRINDNNCSDNLSWILFNIQETPYTDLFSHDTYVFRHTML